MATGYATFLEDTDDSRIAADRFLQLKLSFSEGDEDILMKSTLSKSKIGNADFIRDLVKRGASCFGDNDDHRVFVKPAKTSCAHTIQETDTAAPCLASNAFENCGVQKQHRAKITNNMKKPLIKGRKWASGKMKTAMYVVIGKLLKDDEGAIVTTDAARDGRDLYTINEEKGHDSDADTANTEDDDNMLV